MGFSKNRVAPNLMANHHETPMKMAMLGQTTHFQTNPHDIYAEI